MSTSTTTTASKILYVDDDSDDCIFLRESFSATGTDADIVYASDGEEAIKYLNSIQDESFPSLIILDLNMPRKDGRQTLNYIKSKPGWADIPVVILSTSHNIMDREVCTRLGAASYLQKPFHYAGYKDIVKSCMLLLNTVG